MSNHAKPQIDDSVWNFSEESQDTNINVRLRNWNISEIKRTCVPWRHENASASGGTVNITNVQTGF